MPKAIAVERAGVAPVRAVEALTITPARALGLHHRHGLLAPGFAADTIVLEDDWKVAGVWANGRRL